MDEGTRDAVLVVRLWAEAHDELVRARVLTGDAEQGILAVGVDEIVAVVAAQVRVFAAGGPEPPAAPSAMTER